MNHKHLTICLFVSIVFFAPSIRASSVAEGLGTAIPIWPEGKMPRAQAVIPERLSEQGHLTDVTVPALYFFPAKGEGAKPCVIVCPGGGYSILAYRHEGIELAQWFNGRGINAFVLKYRVPANPDGAFCDGQRAVSFVRAHATDYGTDPNLIGLMGFSAGANLTARVSSDRRRAYDRVDVVDDVSSRPDYSFIIYPWTLVQGDNDEKRLPLMLRDKFPVDADTPSAFLVQAQDDGCHVENALGYFLACKYAGVPCELHAFPDGGHGYGIRYQQNYSVAGWQNLAGKWLERTVKKLRSKK